MVTTKKKTVTSKGRVREGKERVTKEGSASWAEFQEG